MSASLQAAAASTSDSPAQPYVRVESVSKKFGAFTAVDAVSLDIHRQEIFCLLGASGCGKTTLLRMLAGFEEPDGGRIFIDGVDMAGIPPYERPVNMMFQSYALFPHMSVEQNVAFGLKMEHLPKTAITQRVDEMLALVKLSEFAQRKPHQLSGGQRQRVALARALAKRPKLLLLDEPLGALDKKLREHTQFELINIQEQLGVTFMVVTHDQEEAMTLSTRIGVMDRGQLVQVGDPKSIYEYPNSKFVAEFIGSVNLFEGRVLEKSSAQATIDCPELERPIHLDGAIGFDRDAKVWAAIRPEKIHLSLQAPQEAENWTQARVQDSAYMGEMSVFVVRLQSGKLVRVTRPNVWRHEDAAIVRDQPVFLHWHASSPVVVGA